jgi:hypothetical protein
MNHPIPALCGKIQQSIATRCFRGRSGFIWYGIKYYEKAIRTLVKSITPKDQQAPHMAQTQSSDDHASPAVSLSQGDLMVRAEGEDPIVRLLGTCILIQYEALSANRDAWSGHLTGFSKLLDLIDAGQLLNHHPIFEQVYPWTKSIMEVKAGFWNFVANDLEQSCKLSPGEHMFSSSRAFTDFNPSRCPSPDSCRYGEPCTMEKYGTPYRR